MTAWVGCAPRGTFPASAAPGPLLGLKVPATSCVAMETVAMETDAGSGRGRKGLVLGQGTFAQPPVLQGPLTRSRVPSGRESRPAGGSPPAAQAAPPGTSHPPSPAVPSWADPRRRGGALEDGTAAGRRGLRQKASHPEEGACPSDSTGPRGCRGRPGSPGFGQCRDVAAESPALGERRPQSPTGSSQAAPFDEGEAGGTRGPTLSGNHP